MTEEQFWRYASNQYFRAEDNGYIPVGMKGTKKYTAYEAEVIYFIFNYRAWSFKDLIKILKIHKNSLRKLTNRIYSRTMPII